MSRFVLFGKSKSVKEGGSPPSIKHQQKESIMANLSTDKNINDLCNKLLNTRLWKIVRKGKHTILKHISDGAAKFIIVPCTPSDKRAFSNFRRDYYKYLRSFLIANGTIIVK